MKRWRDNVENKKGINRFVFYLVCEEKNSVNPVIHLPQGARGNPRLSTQTLAELLWKVSRVCFLLMNLRKILYFTHFIFNANPYEQY